MLNVLIACEESQTICKEFRKLGHNAFSCDIVSCSGGNPEWHFQQDCLEVIKNKGGKLQTGDSVYITDDWDLLIAHPPCTYLATSGAIWYYHPEDKHLPTEQRRPHPKFPNRKQDRENAIDFFMKLVNADVKHIAIENPVCIMSTYYRKPDQIIQPYQFGDRASKKTCLWLKNLPLLKPTKIVDAGEFVTFKTGKRMAKWFFDALHSKSAEERQRIRSKTFQGIAEAIATQWGAYVGGVKNANQTR